MTYKEVGELLWQIVALVVAILLVSLLITAKKPIGGPKNGEQKLSWMRVVALAGIFLMSMLGIRHSRTGGQVLPVEQPELAHRQRDDARVPVEKLDDANRRLSDLGDGESACTFFGYWVATDDRSVWLDEAARAYGCRYGAENRVMVARWADGWHVHLIGKASKAGMEPAEKFKSRGFVRAVKVTW